MGVDLAPFPSVKVALRALLADLVDSPEYVGVESPNGENWNGSPAFLRIRVYGGRDDTVTDVIRFDIDTLTNNEAESDDLAELVRQRITAASGRRFGDFIFDTAETDTRPHAVPWGNNAAIFNTTAAYRVSARRSSA